MANTPFILQDPTRALVLQTTLDNSGLPVPNGTLTFHSGNDGSVLGSVAVVNPNGAETKLAVGVTVNQNTHDTVVDSTWYDDNITASYSVGIASTGSPQAQSLLDNFGALAGMQGDIILDPDGHSVWASAGGAYDQAFVQKYDLNTKTFVAELNWPFNPQNGFGVGDLFTMEDGTCILFQDTAGHLYGYSNINNTINGPNGTGRLHKLNSSTFAEIAALGYDDAHPSGWTSPNYPVNSMFVRGDYDWALYTRGGKDYIILATGGGALSSSRVQVINLTDMTLFGTYDISTHLGLIAKSVFVDKFGVTWMICNDGGTTSQMFFVKWDPADGTTAADAPPQPPDPVLNNVTLVHTIAGAQYQSGAPFNANFGFAGYVASNHSVLVADFTAPTSQTGDSSDLSAFDLVTGGRNWFQSGGTYPDPFYSGTLDCSFSVMGMLKRQPWIPNTKFAIANFDDPSLIPHQDSGKVNIVDGTTGSVSTTYNLPVIAQAVTTGNGYTDQGVWSSGTHYNANDIVTGSDGFKYVAKVPSGPGSSINVAIDPTTRSSNNPSFTFPTGNALFWSGLPTFTQRINSLGVGNQPAFGPISNLLYIQGVGSDTFVWTHEFTGSPLMMMTATTVVLPTVTTQAESAISSTTATSNGNITNLGGDSSASLRGFVYDTVTHSLPGNVAPGSSGYAHNATSSGSFPTGAYTQGLSGLTPSTTYFVRAVVQNSVGYSYGNEITFTTTAPILNSATAVLVSSLAPSHFEDEVTFTVTVSDPITGDPNLNTAPIGTVLFIADGSFGFGSQPLTPLSASITKVQASLTVATYTATNTFAAGQKVTITGYHGGFTQFNQTNVVIASATSSSFTVNGSYTVQAQTAASGTATSTSASSCAASTTVLISGLHTIQAQYLGDSTPVTGHQPANSNILTQQVVAVNTVNTVEFPGFALIASFTTAGDEGLVAQAQLGAVPSSTHAHVSINLIWVTLNVAFVRITGSNGVDYLPFGFDTGLISTSGSGIYVIGNGFTSNITLTLQAYDASQNPLAGVTSSVHITIS